MIDELFSKLKQFEKSNPYPIRPNTPAFTLWKTIKYADYFFIGWQKP